MYQHYPTRKEVFTSSTCGDYQLLIAWPDEPVPVQGWPVIYLLDGDVHFPVAETLMRTLARPRCCMTPGVVVAIGYLEGTLRERDYRPAVAQRVPESNPLGGYYPIGLAGQSEAFLAFIQHELKPYIRQQFAIDSNREALFGHSYGGLFTLNTLFTCRHAFQHYYASSPSVWWNDGYINDVATSFLQAEVTDEASAASVLFLSVGEWEQSLERWELALPEVQREALRQHRCQRRMVDGVRELAWRLRNAGREVLEVSLFIHAGQSHQSVPLLSLQQAFMHHFQR